MRVLRRNVQALVVVSLLHKQLLLHNFEWLQGFYVTVSISLDIENVLNFDIKVYSDPLSEEFNSSSVEKRDI